MALLPNAGIENFISSSKYVGGKIVEWFLSGFAGYGWKIWKSAVTGRYRLEIDDILVRNTMTVFELIVSKIRAIKGALAITQANGKIEGIGTDGDFYYITLEDEIMSFMAGDFLRHQVFTGTSVRAYWVEVFDVRKVGGIDTIVIPTIEFSGQDLPKIGDDIVQFGNANNTARQSAIYLHADESGQPAIDVMFGINTKSFEDKVKLRLGSGLPGTSETIKGLYAENGMLKFVDSSKNITAQILPTGDAEFGAGAFKANSDRTGYLGGSNGLSWKWDTVKSRFVITMGSNVILTWANLDPDVQEGLRGGKYVFAYRVAATKPATPTGSLIPPTNWYSTPLPATTGTFVWMTSVFVDGDGVVGTWSEPIQISGEAGKPGEDGIGNEFVFIRTKTYATPATPATAQVDDYVPTGWSDDPIGPNAEYLYEWVSMRTKANDVWSDFSTPALWARFSKDGEGGVGSDAYSVQLTSEAGIISVSSAGAVDLSGAYTLVNAFRAATQLAITTLTPITGGYSVAITNVTGGTASLSGNRVTITSRTAGAARVVVTLSINVEGKATIVRSYTAEVVSDGANGSNGSTGPQGPTGGTGAAGQDSYSITLSPPAGIILQNAAGNVNTAYAAFSVAGARAATALTHTTGTPSTGYFRVTYTVTGGTITQTGANFSVNTINSGVDRVVVSLTCNMENKLTITQTYVATRVKDGVDGGSATQLDWIKDWDSNQTEITGGYVVSPRIFAGVKTSGKLTGVALGRDVVSIATGTGASVYNTGLFGLKNGELTFALQADGSAMFAGEVSIASGKIRLATDGSGKIANGGLTWGTDGEITIYKPGTTTAAGKFYTTGAGYLASNNFSWDAAGNVTMKNMTGSNITINSGTFKGNVFVGDKIQLNTAGSGFLAGGNLSWTSEGMMSYKINFSKTWRDATEISSMTETNRTEYFLVSLGTFINYPRNSDSSLKIYAGLPAAVIYPGLEFHFRSSAKTRVAMAEVWLYSAYGIYNGVGNTKYTYVYDHGVSEAQELVITSMHWGGTEYRWVVTSASRDAFKLYNFAGTTASLQEWAATRETPLSDEIALGVVYHNTGTPTIQYRARYGGTMSVSRTSMGVYRVNFPSNWVVSATSYVVFTNGIKGSTVNLNKVTIERFRTYFIANVADDDSANDGDFAFNIVEGFADIQV